MNGFLTLENGDVFEGELIGEEKSVVGEVVFFTGMTGYQEVITDPSYKGQIIVFTYPLIGNYGIHKSDGESEKPHVSGVVLYECNEGFHSESEISLQEYLSTWNVPILQRADTRSIVKTIRTEGVMGGIISSKKEVSLSSPDYQSNNIVEQVTTQKIIEVDGPKEHILIIDFGCKDSIAEAFIQKKYKVTVVPRHTSFEEIESLNPDGVVLSNGPGDPVHAGANLAVIKKVASSYPLLAICLGHQLTALAFGAKTTKLRFGHRGANQPVLDVRTSKVYMTSQNHSYVVDEESLTNTPFQLRWRNINDGSVEGFVHPELPIISVQFHPEAAPGPEDCEWLFDHFLSYVVKQRRENVYA